MLKLRTDAEIHETYLHRLSIAIVQLHSAAKKHGKGNLLWKWRYRLVGNAGRRVTQLEERIQAEKAGSENSDNGSGRNPGRRPETANEPRD